MKLTIKVLQPGHKPRIIESKLHDNFPISKMRELWQVEQTLNDLPGSDLRFHIGLSEEE